jgi:hypothetical protein
MIQIKDINNRKMINSEEQKLSLSLSSAQLSSAQLSLSSSSYLTSSAQAHYFELKSFKTSLNFKKNGKKLFNFLYFT